MTTPQQTQCWNQIQPTQKSWNNQEMCQQVLKLLKPNTTVNLGIGMPSQVASFIPQDWHIMIHSENGVLGIQGRPKKTSVSPTLINAGKETVSIHPYASFFDSSLSFGMIRGGHVDTCILGGMEVDEMGNLANWWVPGKKLTGMGGAMDLVNGAKQVIIMMKHFDKEGTSKIVEHCSLPLTGQQCVDYIVTDYAVLRPKKEQGKGFEIIGLAFT